jgi:glycosyltransferase involved in cell wall biosynthesis
MKVIHVHQHYRIRGGEDAMVEATMAALERRGVQLCFIRRDSRLLSQDLLKRTAAFFSGIYSFKSAAIMRETITREQPDLIHVHNLHPEFSPSVIVASRQAGIPVVMTCHNYRLICPSGMHMREGKICELCLGGREYWCMLKNCKGKIFESIGYALRNALHRKLGLYRDHVSLFIAVSDFVRLRLESGGIPLSRVVVVPNMMTLPKDRGDDCIGEYVAFVGRFSPQKGIPTLLAAAQLTGLPLQLAGDIAAMPDLVRLAPKGTHFAGVLKSAELSDFYRRARFIVVPSECLEPFGLVATEAMSYGRPVIASRIGGLQQIIEDGVTGLLFEPGNALELANMMRHLWNDPDRCKSMGQAGRERVRREFSEDLYAERLIAAYERAIRYEQELRVDRSCYN